MHLKAKRPIFVPERFQREIEQLSKASLMDIAWDYAQNFAENQTDDGIMDEFRKRSEIIMTYRNRK